MKAVLDGTVVAEASDEDVITIEGNSYFPPASLTDGLLARSDRPYTCPWKGVSQYWDLETSQGTTSDGAWSYPQPKASAVQRVGRDFSGYVAFDPALVSVSR